MPRRFVLKPDTHAPSELSIDYAGALNPQQHAAATASGGAVLVVAGAGTGKTRTLVYRVAYLVETGTPPEQIVLLTFTRRAAREMLARASDLLDGRCSRVEGGTFHAFCLSILRRHAPRLGLSRHFTILDAADAGDVLGVLRTAKGFHQHGKRFPRKRTLYNMFSAATNRDEPLSKILRDKYPQFAAFEDELNELREVYGRYKRQHDLVDFDDLLELTLELFDRAPEVRDQVAAGCRHVLVDEYQDTNRLQADLVEQFASVHGNVTVVGDDAQSIYRFRGADFRNIFEFPERFDGTEVLKLEENYRSTQPILNFANRIITGADRSYDKQLFSAREEGDLPGIVPAPDERTESRFVAQLVLALREQDVPLNRMAVLFRSGFNSYDLETELNRRGIPFVKYGGLKLSEAAHVKDVLAHLKVLENPQDAAAWNRVLQLLKGIGPKTAHDLIEWLTDVQNDEPYVLGDRPFSKRYVEAIKRLFEMLRTLKHDDPPLTEQVEAIVEYYEPILEEQYFEDYPKRKPDLDHFAALAKGYDSRSDFLAAVALDPIELSALDLEPDTEDEPPLVLSTIHSAKGLEFHTVFVIQALEGVLPSSYALKEEGGVDEERRLLYVAVTRAEENLFISYPMVQYRRGRGQFFADPSRFIADVPEDVLEPCELVEGDRDTRRLKDADREEPVRLSVPDDGLPF